MSLAVLAHDDDAIVAWLAPLDDEATAREGAWDRMPQDPSVVAVFDLGAFRPSAVRFSRSHGWDVGHVRALLAQHGITVGAEAAAQGDSSPRGFESPSHLPGFGPE